MSEGQKHRRFDCGPILLGLFGILCGVFVVCAFHYIAMGWCNRRRNRAPSEDHISGYNQQMSIPITSNSMSALKVYVYSGGCKEGTCAVCLSEFVEGEEVRILPDCAHTFHVPCVDTWLYSHPSCPLCRACTTPKKAYVVVSLPISGEHSAGLPSPVHDRFSGFDD